MSLDDFLLRRSKTNVFERLWMILEAAEASKGAQKHSKAFASALVGYSSASDACGGK